MFIFYCYKGLFLCEIYSDDKIKVVEDFAPELSECILHLSSYVSLHACIVLIKFCYTALGLLFQSCLKWKLWNWAKAVWGSLPHGKVSTPSTLMYSFIFMLW